MQRYYSIDKKVIRRYSFAVVAHKSWIYYTSSGSINEDNLLIRNWHVSYSIYLS